MSYLLDHPGILNQMIREAHLSLQIYTWPSLVAQYVEIVRKQKRNTYQFQNEAD
jgi:hypothetical protein